MFIFSYFMLWYIWGWCPLDFQDGILVPSLCHVWQMVMCVCPVSDGQDGTVTRTAWVHISQAFCLNLKIKLGPWRWTLGPVEPLLFLSAMLNKCSFSAFRYWEPVSESILAPGRWASFHSRLVEETTSSLSTGLKPSLVLNSTVPWLEQGKTWKEMSPYLSVELLLS